jgi:lantibiotic modifying enzyme
LAPLAVAGTLAPAQADSPARAGTAAQGDAAAQADPVWPAQTDGAYLAAAEQAARWIRSVQIQKEQGIGWLPEPDHPEKTSTEGPDNTIYSGSAGVVLFFLELARATGDRSYLDGAARGADYLVASWRTLPTDRKSSFLAERGLSFDNGLAGTAFTLSEAAKATQNAAYREAAIAATHTIVDAAKPTGDGLQWTPSPAVALDGGLVLYLLYAAKEFDDKKLLKVAARGGDRILQLAEPDPRGGVRWQGLPAEALNTKTSGIPPNAYFPNFELGTAGVAFVLARLYEDTRQVKYLEAAKAGARHLQSIAHVQGDSALVYYREPDHEELYYLGYCHGPAGTARLFYQLYKVTGEPGYLEWTQKLARGVIRSGVPEKLTAGYWNVACQCCGSASEVDFFLSLWLATGDDQYRVFARRVADQLISRQSDLDGKGYRWYQAWTRVKPWEVNAETGYKIGAAGIGAALLHTHLAVRDQYSAILFPDNPFPRTQRT